MDRTACRRWAAADRRPARAAGSDHLAGCSSWVWPPSEYEVAARPHDERRPGLVPNADHGFHDAAVHSPFLNYGPCLHQTAPGGFMRRSFICTTGATAGHADLPRGRRRLAMADEAVDPVLVNGNLDQPMGLDCDRPGPRVRVLDVPS